jgi:hypothetical protein
MSPSKLLAWVSTARPGDRVAYATRPEAQVFETAYRLWREGRVLLYKRHGAWCVQKLSHRARRFVAYVGAHPDRFHYRGE